MLQYGRQGRFSKRCLSVVVVMACLISGVLIWISSANLPTVEHEGMSKAYMKLVNQPNFDVVTENSYKCDCRTSTTTAPKAVPCYVVQTTPQMPVRNLTKELKQSTTNTTKGTTSTSHTQSCLILIWVATERQAEVDWPVEGIKLNRQCRVTYDHKFLEEANVVVIHQEYSAGLIPWEHHRDRHQVFVWWSDINPWILKHKMRETLSEFDGFFNWTMTHRRDSDVYFPLWRKISLYNNVIGGSQEVDGLLKAKTKTAIWIENDCSSSPANNERMRYGVQLVQAKLRISLVGECFKYRNEMPSTNAMAQYRFYMSFMDSMHCIDYITDQLWTPLRLGLVPIVFGPKFEDVANAAPYNSFIHVSRFKSAKHLAQYLLYLESNPTAYRKYFRWRETHDLKSDDELIVSSYPDVELVGYNRSSGWLRLCETYQSTDVRAKSIAIQSLGKFVFGQENENCISNGKPENLFV